MHYALSTTVPAGFEETLDATRAQLAEVGFGVLTELDLAATLKSKIGVDIAPQVVLGACRPQLAHAAMQVEPSIGLLLPCNVVVRAVDEGHTVVETIDPTSMVSITGNDALIDVATEARERLSRALESLTATAASTAG
jgi:uncharacterized protein (DUF302 family)